MTNNTHNYTGLTKMFSIHVIIIISITFNFHNNQQDAVKDIGMSQINSHIMF